jgi:hypothetical protein
MAGAAGMPAAVETAIRTLDLLGLEPGQAILIDDAAAEAGGIHRRCDRAWVSRAFAASHIRPSSRSRAALVGLALWDRAR